MFSISGIVSLISPKWRAVPRKRGAVQLNITVGEVNVDEKMTKRKTRFYERFNLKFSMPFRSAKPTLTLCDKLMKREGTR
jgi:hypothetical protein